MTDFYYCVELTDDMGILYTSNFPKENLDEAIKLFNTSNAKSLIKVISEICSETSL